eukprot:Rmarinus@m.21095
MRLSFIVFLVSCCLCTVCAATVEDRVRSFEEYLGIVSDELDEWADVINYVAPAEFNSDEPWGIFVQYRPGSSDEIIQYGVRLPDPDLNMTLPGNDTFQELVAMFEFPTTAVDLLPFNHMQIAYNTQGHPGGVTADDLAAMGSMTEDEVNAFLASTAYYIPHWDFHFYLSTIDEVMQIECLSYPPCEMDGQMAAEFYNEPPEGYIPDDYWMDIVMAVPEMGMHWHPETNMTQATFATSPIMFFGSYDGEITFWEPMIASDTLRRIKLEGSPFVGAIPQPEYVTKDGYYPHSYTVSYDESTFTYTIAMTDLEYRWVGGVEPLERQVNMVQE